MTTNSYDKLTEISDATVKIMEFIDFSDPKYKEKADIIRTTFELIWIMGSIEGMREIINYADIKEGDDSTAEQSEVES